MEKNTIYHGHVLDVFRKFPNESVNCIVTSVPYWALRDYHIPPQIWGGDAMCRHQWGSQVSIHNHRADICLSKSRTTDRFYGEESRKFDGDHQKHAAGAFCDECGAWLGSYGLEPHPEFYIVHTVEIFREARRILKKDGTLWLNIGDSYAGSRGIGGGVTDSRRRDNSSMPRSDFLIEALKPKDMVGMPWRVALALQSDGWYLRCDIIWHKPNPMPESVTDRPTKAHEYLFLLTKSERYYYNFDAVKEPVTGGAHARGDGVNPKARNWKTPDGWDTTNGLGGHGNCHREGREDGYLNCEQIHNNTRARRSKEGQKSLPTEGLNGIRHRCPKDEGRDERGLKLSARFGRAPGWRVKQNESFSAAVKDIVFTRNMRSVWTVPTAPFSEAHFATFPPKLIEPCVLAGCPEGGIVLDPFMGAGTTGLVANRLNRNFVGIELNHEYVKMALKRIREDAPLFTTDVCRGDD